MDQAKNFAKATVDPEGNYDDTSTSIDLLAGDGLKLPAAPFNAVWWNASDFPDPSDDLGAEVVRVTAVSTDTLTIFRGQEGSDPHDHNLPGKTYKMIAGLTAKVINEQMLDVSKDGDNYSISAVGNLTIAPGGGLTALTLAPSVGQYALGDVDVNNSGAAFIADDSLGHLLLRGPLATDQVASATVAVGTLAGKLAIRDAGGAIVGYVPVYAAIT